MAVLRDAISSKGLGEILSLFSWLREAPVRRMPTVGGANCSKMRVWAVAWLVQIHGQLSVSVRGGYTNDGNA